MVRIHLEFGGGMELLFGNARELVTDIPPEMPGSTVNVGQALEHIRANVLVDKTRSDMFMKGSTIRPGVLVLINDADWELSGLDESELEDGDKLAFISTLHGG